MLQEGSSASVGVTQVATGQEPQEGECRAQPGVPGEWASPCGSPSELFLVVTGLFRVSGVKQVFVPESDALNFLRRNGRRSPRPPQEINGKDVGGLPSAGPLVPSLSQSAGLQEAMGYM